MLLAQSQSLSKPYNNKHGTQLCDKIYLNINEQYDEAYKYYTCNCVKFDGL